MTTALISGAGVAGLTLAHWLRRHGIVPTIVERAPSPRVGGYKIDVRGAALTVVDRMDLLDEIRERRTDVRRATIVDDAGRRVAAMDGDTFGGREHEDAEIRRGDLLELLLAAAGDTEIRWGDVITALVDDGDGVDVTFASGDVRRFDLVVGADGVHSATRGLLFGNAEEHVTDLGHRIAVFGVPNDLGLDREEVTYVAPGRTALVYHTAGAARATAMLLFAGDGPLPRDGKGLLRETFAGQGWEVPRLLEHLERADDLYLDTLSQVTLEHWSRGRVGLLGDAAYCASPASGQGTSLALVGAYVLAGELARGGGFAGYERAVRQFVARNQALARPNLSRMVMRTPRQVRTAMTMLSVMERLPGSGRMAELATRPVARAARAISLADYRASSSESTSVTPPA